MYKSRTRILIDDIIFIRTSNPHWWQCINQELESSLMTVFSSVTSNPALITMYKSRTRILIDDSIFISASNPHWWQCINQELDSTVFSSSIDDSRILIWHHQDLEPALITMYKSRTRILIDDSIFISASNPHWWRYINQELESSLMTVFSSGPRTRIGDNV